MSASVYLITNLVNGKLYIGKAKNPVNRWSVHLYPSKKPSPKSLIAKAIKKYGRDNFTFEVLETFSTEEEAFWWESWWIQYLGTNDYGYNLNYGETGGQSISEATRALLSPEAVANQAASIRGRPQTPEHIEKRISALRGRPRSEETKAKISVTKNSQAGRERAILAHASTSPSQECRDKSLLANRGRPLSEEHKSKISKSLVGRVQNPDVVEKRASKLRGLRRSPEVRRKLSELRTKRGNQNILPSEVSNE